MWLVQYTHLEGRNRIVKPVYMFTLKPFNIMYENTFEQLAYNVFALHQKHVFELFHENRLQIL